MIIPVILSGGMGTRLWPLSRTVYPKQFMPLISERSLLQETLLRTKGLDNVAPPLIICHEDHRFIVAQQCKEIGIDNATIILEPEGRNTAAAATIAALHVQSLHHDEDVLLIMPADHMIKELPRLHEALQEAQPAALDGKLMTFGITAETPETGFGYIQQGEPNTHTHVYDVKRFAEKPNYETAQAFIDSGDYFWNSGIFMFTASTWLTEAKSYCPELLTHCQTAYTEAEKDLDFHRLEKTAFLKNPTISIDVAVMEKTTRAGMVRLSAPWSDVGSWSALWDTSDRDHNDNVIQGDVFTESVTNSYIRAQSRMVAAIGVTDHVIVETPDAVLVTHKNTCQDVQTLVKQLKSFERHEAHEHTTTYRPWGTVECLKKNTHYRVNRLFINPHAAIATQIHQHRTEHWIVLSGTATVTAGNTTTQLAPNESTFIPKKQQHSLKNETDSPLILIEIQAGECLSEADVERM